MLAFDGAADVQKKLDILTGLTRLRLMVLRFIGWPKEPTMRPQKLPTALDGVRHHNPLGDVDVPSMTVPEPAPGDPQG